MPPLPLPLPCSSTARKATVVAAFLAAAAVSRTAPADVVVLQNGQSYSGVIVDYTTETVQLFDGNLRRILALAGVQRVVQERPDTSWILVGDRMLEQKDWRTAADAYQKALEATVRLGDQAQPFVPLERLAKLRAHRFHIPGAEQALALLESGDYRQAAQALAPFVSQSAGAAQRHYWVERLARAYAGMAMENPTTATREVNAWLVYALGIAPDCGPARAALAEHLLRNGHPDVARIELAVALDLNPTDQRARQRLLDLGQEWQFTTSPAQSSPLLVWAQRQPPIQPTGAAPLTTASIAAAVQGQILRGVRPPARILLAAFLLDPTAALANQGSLPYPGLESLLSDVFDEAADAKGTTAFDKGIIAAAVKVRIDPRFVRALAKVLSGLEPDYTSPDGERGLIPLSRRQWAIAARSAGVGWDFEKDSHAVEKNLTLACQYLNWLRREALAPWVGGRLDRLERVD